MNRALTLNYTWLVGRLKKILPITKSNNKKVVRIKTSHVATWSAIFNRLHPRFIICKLSNFENENFCNAKSGLYILHALIKYCLPFIILNTVFANQRVLNAIKIILKEINNKFLLVYQLCSRYMSSMRVPARVTAYITCSMTREIDSSDRRNNNVDRIKNTKLKNEY